MVTQVLLINVLSTQTRPWEVSSCAKRFWFAITLAFFPCPEMISYCVSSTPESVLGFFQAYSNATMFLFDFSLREQIGIVEKGVQFLFDFELSRNLDCPYWFNRDPHFSVLCYSCVKSQITDTGNRKKYPWQLCTKRIHPSMNNNLLVKNLTDMNSQMWHSLIDQDRLSFQNSFGFTCF